MPHPSANLAMLDQDELFQLAVNASYAGESACAIAYLKEAVIRDDASAKAHYLLGAEYAQIRMYQRAVEFMTSALALDPTLSVARVQLGLLWLTASDAGRAASVLAPLSELLDSDPLRHFGAGLCHLIQNRIAEVQVSLEQGIALNTAILPLNTDMRRILDALARLGSDKPGAPPETTGAQASEEGQHILLSAYTGNTSH
jgi:tetratricopeptide (TPR) repeat protein